VRENSAIVLREIWKDPFFRQKQQVSAALRHSKSALSSIDFDELMTRLRRVRKNSEQEGNLEKAVPRWLKPRVELMGFDVRAKARTLQNTGFSAG
jgi:hypothetical protein